jgi:hypothetical protein
MKLYAIDLYDAAFLDADGKYLPPFDPSSPEPQDQAAAAAYKERKAYYTMIESLGLKVKYKNHIPIITAADIYGKLAEG